MQRRPLSGLAWRAAVSATGRPRGRRARPQRPLSIKEEQPGFGNRKSGVKKEQVVKFCMSGATNLVRNLGFLAESRPCLA